MPPNGPSSRSDASHPPFQRTPPPPSRSNASPPASPRADLFSPDLDADVAAPHAQKPSRHHYSFSLQIPTPPQYFLLRITPEMEAHLRFLLTRVKWGNQRRYQAWFAKKHLCSPESETVVIHIVRFIYCAHRPSNEIIQSNAISQWAVNSWLMKFCGKNYFLANAKLALFYDWLFFDEKLDNIMSIELAMLLMVNSVAQYVDMTHMLLEFFFCWLIIMMYRGETSLLRREACFLDSSFKHCGCQSFVRNVWASSKNNIYYEMLEFGKVITTEEWCCSNALTILLP